MKKILILKNYKTYLALNARRHHAQKKTYKLQISEKMYIS